MFFVSVFRACDCACACVCACVCVCCDFGCIGVVVFFMYVCLLLSSLFVLVFNAVVVCGCVCLLLCVFSMRIHI